jgi:hypothetical protein
MFRKQLTVVVLAALALTASAAYGKNSKMTTAQKTAKKVKYFNLCVGDTSVADDFDDATDVASVLTLYECGVSTKVCLLEKVTMRPCA